MARCFERLNSSEMKYTRFSIYLLLSFPLAAQTWQWDSLAPVKSRIYPAGGQHAYCIIGNSLAKVDHQFQIAWQYALPLNFEPSYLSVSPDSTVYLSGLFEDTLALGSNTFASKGDKDICIARFSSSGNLLWARQIGTKNEDLPCDVGSDPTSVVVGGRLNDTVYINNQMFPKSQWTEFFILRLDTSGSTDTLVLATQLFSNFPVSYACEIEIDKQGDIVFLHGAALYSWNNTLTYLTKLNTNFQVSWSHTIGASPEGSYALKTDPLNRITFISTSANFQSGSNHEWSRIRQFSSTGTQLSQYAYIKRGTMADYNLDSCNNIYVTGYQRRVVPSQFYLTNTKLSPQLMLHWQKEDSSGFWRTGTGIFPYGDNECYVTAAFINSITVISTFTTTSSTISNAVRFVARLKTQLGFPLNTTPASLLTKCESNTTTLSANANGLISWFSSGTATVPVQTGPVYVTPPLTPGNYTYYVEASSCSVTTGRMPITLTVNPNPSVSVNDMHVCAGKPFTLSPTGAEFYSYLPNGPALIATVPTNYTIIGGNSFGCLDTAVCQVTVHKQPQVSVSTNKNFLCSGDTAILTASGAFSYTWTGGTVSPSLAVSPKTHTFISVTGANQYGCANKASITQFVPDCVGLADYSDDWLEIFPNPSSGRIHCRTTSACTIEIFSVTGALVLSRCVKQGELITFDLSKGLHIAKALSGSARVTKKIVVE
jgi:hypothetical protein